MRISLPVVNILRGSYSTELRYYAQVCLKSNSDRYTSTVDNIGKRRNKNQYQHFVNDHPTIDHQDYVFQTNYSCTWNGPPFSIYVTRGKEIAVNAVKR